MSNQQEDKAIANPLKELLDRLQVESWQLELLVSGFAIFLAIGSIDGILEYGKKVRVIEDGLGMDIQFLSIFWVLGLGISFFVAVNLILHVVFRGMWISAIGLRSISGDINFEVFNFVRPFDKYLRKKLGAFDDFIQRLEDISSVIFAFTFLIIFMMISIALYFFVLLLYMSLVDAYYDYIPVFFENVVIILVFLYLFIGVLYILDFMSLGFFKRKRWIAVWYYPIYRLMSAITFSWLYRPLYYNLIDNRFGRRVGVFLVPYLIGVMIYASMEVNINQYIPTEEGGLFIKDNYFDDRRSDDELIQNISIPSQYIENGFLDLFILYDAVPIENTLGQLYPNIILDDDEGISLPAIIINRGGVKEDETTAPDSLLNVISNLYELRINDSLYQELDFYFYKKPKYGQEGIRAIIDVQSLGRGKHVLKIKRKIWDFDEAELVSRSYIQTPFWIE